MLGPLLLSSLLLGPPANDEAAASYRPPQARTGEQGKLEAIFGLMSLRLGLGPAFHPKLVPDKGFAIDARVGMVFLIPPALAVWPELGGSFEVREGFERGLGTVDLNVGLPAFLYYGVGFEGGVEGHAHLLGFRHGLDLRFFQVFGIAVMHHINHTDRRGLQHDIRLMFSFDALAVAPLTGAKGTVFKVGERRVGR